MRSDDPLERDAFAIHDAREGMTTATNLPLYQLLIKLGATEAEAAGAATADESHLVTKTDLRAEMADLRSDLLKWGVTLLFTGLAMQTGLVIFALSRLARP